jgi:hypothetical protein
MLAYRLGRGMILAMRFHAEGGHSSRLTASLDTLKKATIEPFSRHAYVTHINSEAPTIESL